MDGDAKTFCGEGRGGPDGVTDVWERGMSGAGRGRGVKRQVEGRRKDEDGRALGDGMKGGTGAWDMGEVEGEATLERVRVVAGRSE